MQTVTFKVVSVDEVAGTMVIRWNDDVTMEWNYDIPRDPSTNVPLWGESFKVDMAQRIFSTLKAREEQRNADYSEFKASMEDQVVDITTEINELDALVKIQEGVGVELETFQT